MRDKREQVGYRHAQETLYLVAEYFAYEPFMLRYTPYGTDPKLVAQILRIRDEFATDRGYADPWCIFRPRQKALGQLVLSSRQAEQGFDVDTIPLLEFQKKLAHNDTAKSLYLEQALSEMNAAENVGGLEQRTQLRLAKVQSYLVELLEYFERELGRLRKGQPFKRVRFLFPSEDKGMEQKRAYNGACERCAQLEVAVLKHVRPVFDQLKLHDSHSR